MFTNQCSKCGEGFETKNPKRVICPNCLYPEGAMASPRPAAPQSYGAPQPQPRPFTPQQHFQQAPYPAQRPVAYNQPRPGGGYPPQQRPGGFQPNPQQRPNFGYNQQRPPGQYGPPQQGRPPGQFNGPRPGFGQQQRPGAFGPPRPPGPGGFQKPRPGGFAPPRGQFGPPRGPGIRPGFGPPRGPGGRPGMQRGGPKKLLVTRDQLIQIEALYKQYLPLPNPDVHEVIGEQINIAPSKTFFGINLVREKMRLPKLEYPKRKLAVTPEQLMAIETLYDPYLPLPPIGIHKIIAKQLRMDEWRVHVAIGLIRKNRNMSRWNEDREDLPPEMKESQERAKLEKEQREIILAAQRAAAQEEAKNQPPPEEEDPTAEIAQEEGATPEEFVEIPSSEDGASLDDLFALEDIMVNSAPETAQEAASTEESPSFSASQTVEEIKPKATRGRKPKAASATEERVVAAATDKAESTTETTPVVRRRGRPPKVATAKADA